MASFSYWEYRVKYGGQLSLLADWKSRRRGGRAPVDAKPDLLPTRFPGRRGEDSSRQIIPSLTWKLSVSRSDLPLHARGASGSSLMSVEWP